MENTCSNSFSQSILDKFRSISKESEDPKPSVARNPSNGSNAAAQNQRSSFSKRNGNESGGTKRKYPIIVEEIEAAPGLAETDVGITQYINNLEGFSGIIKHRFSDFQVNEIDPAGNVVELNSFEIPPDPVEEESDDYESVLTEDEWKKLDEMVKSTDKNAESIFIDVTEKSKEERTSIHMAARKKYGGEIISNTKEVEDKKFLEIKKKTKRDTRGEWPRGRGVYLHCAMYKVSKDTTELVHLLAERLRTKNNLIGYAGTKDKRAKTTQRISFKKKTAEALLRLNIRNVVFGNFSYQNKEIQLGENRGNRFRIAIRNVQASDEIIDANMNSLKENGFINYFGMQRFGNYSVVPTYAVGKALLASDWKLAIELILKPKPGSKRRKELLVAQQSWYKDRDAAAAVKWIPRFDNTLEAKILRTLKAQGNTAYLNALMALPRHTMTMYLHSYQSLIWNRIVSKRIEKFGMKPQAGDLLVMEEVDSFEEADVEESEDEASEGSSQASCNTANDSRPEDEKRSKVKRKMKVREITEEEVDKVSISDIVYPLPGNDVTYPNNEIKTWYEEILAENNFTFDNFTNSHKNFSLGGAYRRLLTKPGDISWNIVYCDTLEQDLILSDDDKLNNVKLPENNQDGQYKSVVVSFNLDSCSYATMALREIMKCDTSTYHQTQLTEKLISTDQEEKTKKMKT